MARKGCPLLVLILLFTQADLLFAVSDCQDCISINEFQYAPVEGLNGDQDNTGEYVELFNTCNDTVDIGCMQLCMLTGSYCGECVQIPSGTLLGPGEVFLMGGYGTNCSGGGVSTCDWPNLNLDLNWHDCGCVNDPDEGVSCSSSNSGSYWGVLIDSGEDLYLFDENDSLVQGLTYDGGGGYSDGDCTGGGNISMNGCNGCSGSTVDPPSSGSLTNLGGGSGTGFITDCGGGYTEVSDTTNLSPGVADCSTLIDPPCCTVESGFTVDDDAQCVSKDTFSFQNTGSSGGSVYHEYSYGDGSSDSLENPDHSYSDTGVYQVRQIVDSNHQCLDTSYRTVVVGTVDVSIAPPDTLTCAVDSVQLDGSASSSWPGSTLYSWSTSGGNILSGSGTATPWVDEAASYQLTVTDDSLACSKDSTVTVPIDTAAPTIDIASPDTFTCSTDSLQLDASTSTSNSGQKDYSWTAVTGNILNGANTDTPYVGSSGEYALTLTDPENGCTSQDSVTVPADNELPTVNVAPIDTIECSNAVVRIDASGSTSKSGNKDYSWSHSGGNITNAAADSAWIDVDVATTYTVAVTDPNNGCTNSSSETVPIDTVSPEAIVATPDTLTCATNTVTIDASGSTSNSGQMTFLWSTSGGNITGSAPDSSWIEVDTKASYTVTVTDTNNGCIDDTTVTVGSDTAQPNADIAPVDTLTCTKTSDTLNASASSSNSGATDWSWSTSGGNIVATDADSSFIEADAGGTYTLTITDTMNGCTDDTSVTLDLDTASPDAAIAGADTIDCSDPTDTLDASGSSTASGGTKWNWSTGGGNINSAFPDSSRVYVDKEGSYTVTVTDTLNGCTDDSTVTVGLDTAAPTISVAPIDTLSCKKNEVRIDASPSSTNSGSIDFGWSSSGGNIVDAAADSSWVDVDAAASYNVTVTDPKNGCSSTSTVTLPLDTTSPDAELAAVDPITCDQPTVSIDASGSAVSGGDPVFSWSSSSGNIVSASGDSSSISVDAGASYTVTVMDSSNGCTDDTSASVSMDTARPNISVLPPDTFYCDTDPFALDASASTSSSGDRVFAWNAAQGVILSGDSSATPTVGSAGSYELELTDPANGCNNIDTVRVPEDPTAPTADFVPQPSEGEVPLDVEFKDQSSNANSYFWAFGDGDSAFVPSPSHTYLEEGTYTIRLEVRNERGCIDTAIYRSIIVERSFEWEIPNVFSPNGDGKNDRFRVDAQSVKSFEGRIYNRWGQLLHHWREAGAGWDGKTPQGGEAPEGTYYFTLKVVDKEGKEHTEQGQLTLFR